MKHKVFRPDLDDIERLSYGKGAKKQRGTGSRYVCHRLNRDERKLYDLAKKSCFLTTRGTGYRKERKGSPLCNTYRQRCDAQEEICIIVEKRSDQDTLILDFSTLRVADDTPFVSLIMENVFKAKYPELYNIIMENSTSDAAEDAKNVEGTDDGGNPVNGKANVDYSKVIRTPISDWDAVRTKPIWCINERIITLPCDRDLAKSLAHDVSKESSKFSLIPHEDQVIQKDTDGNGDLLTDDNHNDIALLNSTDVEVHDGKDYDDEDDCIDWNDI